MRPQITTIYALKNFQNLQQPRHLIQSLWYICGKNIAKNCTSKLTNIGHHLGKTKLTKHWQKVRPKFGQSSAKVRPKFGGTEGLFDHYL